MLVLDIRNLNKTFGKDTLAVKDFSLTVEEGDFIVLVGPSGCGKTTTLRMIAGLEEPDSGSILLNSKDLVQLSPEKRDIAMVFQDYALYPHMTVFDNIAFPLKLSKVPKDEIEQRVRNVCETLGISELTNRKPKQLSGGQKQRVAMGRALIRKPKLFLMDEPLSNLDAKLRVQTRNEIARIQKNLNVTIIFVTHDQTEAMTLADKIVVMDKGTIVQVGTPQELYDYPCNTFIAEFMGIPPMNLIEARLENEKVQVRGQSAGIAIPECIKEWALQTKEQRLLIGIHPEDMNVGHVSASDSIELSGQLVNTEELGYEAIHYYSLPDNREIKARVNSRLLDNEDSGIVNFSINKALFFDAESGMRIS